MHTNRPEKRSTPALSLLVSVIGLCLMGHVLAGCYHHNRYFFQVTSTEGAPIADAALAVRPMGAFVVPPGPAFPKGKTDSNGRWDGRVWDGTTYI